MTKSKNAAIVPVEGEAKPVEIVFDFEQVDLFDFLDLMELSAKSKDGDSTDPSDVMKFIRVLKSAYVSSSRPLKVPDFQALMEGFSKQAELFKNPNA